MSSAATSPVFTNAAGTLAAHPQGYAIVRYHPATVELPALPELLTRLGQRRRRRGRHRVLVDSRARAIFRQEVTRIYDSLATAKAGARRAVGY